MGLCVLFTREAGVLSCALITDLVRGSKGETVNSAKLFILMLAFRLKVWCLVEVLGGFPGGTTVKNPPVNAGDAGLMPGLGRSPGEENGSQESQDSCLGNPWTRGAWRAAVHGVVRSRTRRSD